MCHGSKEISDFDLAPKPPEIDLEIRFVGLRRSGNHAVLNWIAGLFDGPICFVNDISNQPYVGDDQRCDPLPSIMNERKASLSDDHYLRLISFEDTRLVAIKSETFSKLFDSQASQKRIDIILLRDPYNTFASRLKLKRDQPNNPFTKFMLKPCGLPLPELWKRYAHEFIGTTNHLERDKISINFNRWVVDESYRWELCEQIGGDFRDDHKEQIPFYGFGSSFNHLEFNGWASHMQLDRRWREFVNDDEYSSLFCDPTVLELSDAIFGDCFTSPSF